MITNPAVDRRYLEPMFGLGPPATCRARLAPVVPARQLALFAVAWFAHAVHRDGLAAYLAESTSACLAELRRGLRLLGERDVADAVAIVAALPWPAPRLLAAIERRVPADLYDRVVDHARAHASELVALDGELPVRAFAAPARN